MYLSEVDFFSSTKHMPLIVREEWVRALQSRKQGLSGWKGVYFIDKGGLFHRQEGGTS